MMSRWRAIWRLTLLVLWLLLGALLALVRLSVEPSRAYRVSERQLIAWWSRQLLAVLGVNLSYQGQPIQGAVWVANHHSWLDIVVVMALSPVRFLSKQEVADWPLIGWLAKRAGTLFLKRGQGETAQAMQQMSKLVQAGDSVLFFPEGTTTDHAPKAFHARLFALPIELGVSVQPLCLSYHDGQSSRPDIAYVGDQSFMTNLWFLLKQHNIHAQLEFMSAIDVDANTSRNQLSQQTHSKIEHLWLVNHRP
jgi:1-acyl-sn-glycerol-3-phosphate acyltransferase